MDATLVVTVPQTEGSHSASFARGGMIVREREPLNIEMPFGLLDGFIAMQAEDNRNEGQNRFQLHTANDQPCNGQHTGQAPA